MVLIFEQAFGPDFVTVGAGTVVSAP